MAQEHKKYELQVPYGTAYIIMYTKQRKLSANLPVWTRSGWPNFILGTHALMYIAKRDFLLFFNPTPFQGHKSPRLPTWFVDSLGLLLHRSNIRS